MPTKRPPTPASKYKAKRTGRAETSTRRPNIQAHDYNPETGQLTVTFHNGRRYCYSGIPAELARNFKGADSQGTFLHKHIVGRFDGKVMPD